MVERKCARTHTHRNWLGYLVFFFRIYKTLFENRIDRKDDQLNNPSRRKMLHVYRYTVTNFSALFFNARLSTDVRGERCKNMHVAMEVKNWKSPSCCAIEVYTSLYAGYQVDLNFYRENFSLALLNKFLRAQEMVKDVCGMYR